MQELIMLNGRLISATFLLGLLGFASMVSAKTFRVGLVFRYDYEFDAVCLTLTKGIGAAKDLFEKTHPNVKIELKRYAHGETLESVVAATEKVIHDKIPAVIGGNQSNESIVIAEQLDPKKIVFITPTSSHPKVTENKDFAFRVCFTDDEVSAKLAKFVAEKLKPTILGVVHNISEPYPDYLTSHFLEAFRQKMPKLPTIEEKIVRGQIHFEDIISKFMEGKVTHVLMLTYDTHLFRFVAQASGKGFFPVYIGSDGWGNDNYVIKSVIESKAEGQKFIGFRNTYWNPDLKTPFGEKFKQTYLHLFNEEPNAWSAIAFDAAWVLFEAMNRSKDPENSKEIQQHLRKLKKVSLVTSNDFSFGPNNSPRRELVIFRIDHMGSHFVETLP